MGRKDKSLDELESEGLYAKGLRRPCDYTAREVSLNDLQLSNQYQSEEIISLDGEWLLCKQGEPWDKAIKANVPCSVHQALQNEGLLPDPNVGRNQVLACEMSFQAWQLKREFDCDDPSFDRQLEFDGVADGCEVWLNGELLGYHKGMFGGPSLNVSGKLRLHNEITVKLDPIGYVYNPYHGSNNAWMQSVVINCVYGWHYSNMPSLGIWQSVRLRRRTAVEMESPFFFTMDALSGEVGLVLSFSNQVTGRLAFSLKPLNFEGGEYGFEEELCGCDDTLRYRFIVPSHRLWWPVDLGEPYLYELFVSFEGENIKPLCFCETVGIRTIETRPLAGGANEEFYNWRFVINKKEVFIKGTGWCTMDTMLNFPKERYERFIKLAKEQHVQMLRAWGCGMPELNAFYELCDRYGILVLQEWPTAWDSHEVQPLELLCETAVSHTIRLRNHPSFAVIGTGNESAKPFGAAIDKMMETAFTLDGTRPFHRGEPYGGSKHDYTCYWGRQHLDYCLTMTAPFWGEYGIASLPSCKSQYQYLPKEEQKLWPPPKNGSFEYHTPIFGDAEDVDRLMQFAGYFLPENFTFEELTISSQLAQAVGVRRALERARCRFPDCGGALYYKLNDNFPAMSWSCVDWYGVPKLSYYVFQDSFEPIRTCLLFDRLDFFKTPQSIPVFLLDDAGELKGRKWLVTVKAYDETLKLLKETSFSQTTSDAAPFELGRFELSREETMHSPLLLVAEVEYGKNKISRGFYFENFERSSGCLFRLPRCSLSLKTENHTAIIKNMGDVPAVGCFLETSEFDAYFEASDNFFWLNPGEKVKIRVNITQGLTISALNSV